MFRHLLLASAVLGLLAASTESANAQKIFRGNNPATAPPPAIFPPAPQIPLLNNGSLQTTANPNSALPSQVPYIYIAGMAQDARLNNNGVFIWQPRLDSAVTALQNQQQNQNLGSNLGSNQGLNQGLNLGGNINLGGNLGLNLGGLVNGFGAMRSPALAGYGYPGYYGGLGINPGALMGNNFGGYVSQMQQPFANPNPVGLGNNFGPVDGVQANFFANPNPGGAGNAFANLGNFGGDANPFDIFKAAKPDANDDKKKHDEEKDKEKKNPARKDDDADKQR